MSSTTEKRHPLQVNDATYRTVREMSEASNTPMTKIVERAVEAYRNEMLLKAHNEAWAQLLEEDPEAIAELKAEHELWDRTTTDGMGTKE